MNQMPSKRVFAAIAACFSLALGGCFVSPGKFASELMLRKDNTFRFTYEGEILFLGLSQLAKMGAEADQPFAPICYNFGEPTYEQQPSTEGEPVIEDVVPPVGDAQGLAPVATIASPNVTNERPCTDEEIAEQRDYWEEDAARRAEERKRKAEQIAQIMGEIDPDSPEAEQELAQLLLRHRGWEAVEAKGDGVYQVRFAIDSVLTHGFAFPSLEKFLVIEPFVQVVLRKDAKVRIDAPAFAARSDSNTYGGMAGGMTGLWAFGSILGASEAHGEQPAKPPRLEGTFSIVTDGEILANNTDEGPASDGPNKRLSWKIDSQTASAPTALIGLGR
jgi:hypothetical protein